MSTFTSPANSWKLKRLYCRNDGTFPGYFNLQYHFRDTLTELYIPTGHQDFQKLLNFNRIDCLRFGQGILKAWCDWVQQRETERLTEIRNFLKTVKTLELSRLDSITEDQVALLQEEVTRLNNFSVNDGSSFPYFGYLLDGDAATSLFNFAAQNSESFSITIPVRLNHSRFVDVYQNSLLGSNDKINTLSISEENQLLTESEVSASAFTIQRLLLEKQSSTQTNIGWKYYVHPFGPASTIKQDLRRLKGEIGGTDTLDKCNDDTLAVGEVIDAILCAITVNGLQVKRLSVTDAFLEPYENTTGLSNRGTCITELVIVGPKHIHGNIFPALSLDLPHLRLFEINYLGYAEVSKLDIIMEHTNLGTFVFSGGKKQSIILKIESLEQKFVWYFISRVDQSIIKEVSVDEYNCLKDFFDGIGIYLRCKSIKSFSFSTVGKKALVREMTPSFT